MDWFANWISDLMVKFGLLSSPDDRKLAKELANFKEKENSREWFETNRVIAYFKKTQQSKKKS